MKIIPCQPVEVEVLKINGNVVLDIDDPAKSYLESVAYSPEDARKFAAQMIVAADEIDDEIDAAETEDE